jgi:hypothetical protein
MQAEQIPFALTALNTKTKLFPTVSRFRSLVIPLTVAWLSVHVLVLGGTFVVVSSTGDGHDIVCTCAHGADHGSCPMHRTSTDLIRCRLQNTQDGLGGALMSLLGPVALPATFHAAAVDAPASRPMGEASPLPFDRIVPPEPPPPRG